ncbi:sentrin-specific protease 6 [Cricetulus griseus]|uniref:Sentrin-specific protease 6 n=1 Tax=Cricetulus griseus TaxID=10029 RepID=A0A061I1U4_CRIGR|nr:sentrin-specific protease 6 [Cricetulus griseus]
MICPVNSLQATELNRRSEIVATSSGDFILKTYVRRSKTDSFKTLKGNPIGLNMLSNNKKLSNQDRNERKEYPPHVQKAENNPVMLSHVQGVG